MGKKSNRDAIGAKVKVTTATGRVLYNHVSVSSASCPRATGDCTSASAGDSAVRSIEIRWPSGKTQTLEDVKVDRVLGVEEPS